jgi:thaumarchaeosortase
MIENEKTLKLNMIDITDETRKAGTVLAKLVPIISFIVPITILYFLYPNSFESTWKGRLYYLFFLWLVSLETILSWETINLKIHRLKSAKTVLILVSSLLPLAYVLISQFLGLNRIFIDLALKSGMDPNFANNSFPLSIEYLVFTVLFVVIVTLCYGISSLQEYSISTVFLGLIGMIYVTDDMYPYGRFTPFQLLVPTTARLAAGLLNLMGYQTIWLGIRNGMPILSASDGVRSSGPLAIAWPCSGIASLLIYTVTILLFFKKTNISWKQRAVYFLIGAVITYFINIVRIATIFIMAINQQDWIRFHDLYGQLFSITWIISYPLIIIGSRVLWKKIRK